MVNISMPLTQSRLLLDDPGKKKTFLIYTEFYFIFIFSGNLLCFFNLFFLIILPDNQINKQSIYLIPPPQLSPLTAEFMNTIH